MNLFLNIVSIAIIPITIFLCAHMIYKTYKSRQSPIKGLERTRSLLLLNTCALLFVQDYMGQSFIYVAMALLCILVGMTTYYLEGAQGTKA